MANNNPTLTKEARELMAEYMREYRMRNPRKIREIVRRSKAKRRIIQCEILTMPNKKRSGNNGS
jgi:hypothetical protein